jgi:hypothetical protein
MSARIMVGAIHLTVSTITYQFGEMTNEKRARPMPPLLQDQSAETIETRGACLALPTARAG